MQRITSRAIGLLVRLAGMLFGAGLAVILVTGVAAAHPASSGASAYSANSSVQQVWQRQKTFTVAAPVTVLSGNAVSVLSSGDTTSNSFSGVVVAPTQSSSQSNHQTSSAKARGTGHAEDCGCGGWHDARSGARASSRNSSVQQSDQSQKTVTIAAPITLLSGNAVSILSSGDTTSNSFSGVLVAPTQSSSQSNVQSSAARASTKSHGDSHQWDGRSGEHGSKASARSRNASVQQSHQSQKTVTVAAPVTVLSGNAVSVGSSGDTTSNSFSGVVVAPTQSSSQSNHQSSGAHARGIAQPVNEGCKYHCGCTHLCEMGSSGHTQASSRNSNVQQSHQSQKTVTVAAPVTAASGNAVSVLSSGNTTSNSFSGVAVAPTQSSSQSNVQSSVASAASSLGGSGH